MHPAQMLEFVISQGFYHSKLWYLIYALVCLVLVAIPGVPLVLLWRRIFGHQISVRQPSVILKWLLAMTTVSAAWILLSLLWKPLLGRDYSTRRFIAIYANFLLMVVIGVGAIFIKNPAKRLLIASAFAVAFDWFYAAVISLAV